MDGKRLRIDSPPTHRTRKSAHECGSRLMKRIKEKCDWEKLLEEAGLGWERIMSKLSELLEAETTKFYFGKAVANITDNSTRMRAVELLADLHGLRKQEVKISGEIKTRTEPDLSALSDHELDELERIAEKLERQHIQN